MSALYRIVQDEYPPFPTNISNNLKDFLMKCFQKEPFFRKNAQDLLQHLWLGNVVTNKFEINEDIQTQESDEEEIFGTSNSHLKEEKKNEFSYKNSSKILKNFITNSLKSDCSIDKSIIEEQNSDVTIEEELSTIQDHTELDSLLETLDMTQTPKTLHKVLELLSAQPSLKKHSADLLPILKQVLDDNEDLESLHLALQLTNCVCTEENYKEASGSIGLLSSALKFISEEFCKELRIEAGFLIGQFFSSSEAMLKILLASGGIEAIVKLLDPNFIENKELAVLGIDCLMNLIEESGNRYLRICATHGAIERLALALNHLSSDSNNINYLEKTADLLYVFSTVSLI